MLIFRGWGIIVPVIVFFSSLVAEIMTVAIAGEGYWDKHGWPFATALIAAGIFNELTDFVLHRKPARVLVDEETGERFVVQQVHDFFFLRPRWWALICVGGAIVTLATDFAPGKA